jgi:hypothetical protein
MLNLKAEEEPDGFQISRLQFMFPVGGTRQSENGPTLALIAPNPGDNEDLCGRAGRGSRLNNGTWRHIAGCVAMTV